MNIPYAMQRVINSFNRLPGIGPKTAIRLAFFLLSANPAEIAEFSEALKEFRANVHLCPVCFSLSEKGDVPCAICSEARRSAAQICVVSSPQDVVSIERSGAFRGKYHVLHGLLSPLEGIGPEDLKIEGLQQRVQSGQVAELILATNPTTEGDATSLYLKNIFAGSGIKVTRLARGLAAGSDLQFTDNATLSRALSDRSPA